MRRITTLARSLALLLVAAPALAGWEEGVAAFTARNFTQAVNEFREMVEQNPDSYQAHYMLGLSLEQLGRKEEALSALLKARDLNPNEVGAKLSLGRAYHGLGRHHEALKQLAGIDASSLPLAQQPGFYKLRAQARLRAGDTSAAVADLGRLARLRPDDAEVQFLFGTAALRAGDMDNGLRALALASKLAPGDEDMKRAYVRALLASARTHRDRASKIDDFGRAATVARELVATNPSYDNLVLKLSAELGAGSYEEAIETGKTAVAKGGDDWLGHYYLGQAYTSAGQYQEAEGPLKTAADKTTKPGDLELISRQLGFVYEQQARYSDAIAAYQLAGDQGSVARVRENEAMARQNAQIDEEARRVEQMRREAEELEKQLEAMESGGGGR